MSSLAEVEHEQEAEGHDRCTRPDAAWCAKPDNDLQQTEII
jgi:hypothetical protein